MADRTHNFNAGPAALPRAVLDQLGGALIDYDGLGLGVMEMSHRSKPFEAILERARAAYTTLYDVPDSHEVLFLQGGASLQFAMIPLNLGSGGAYINTGTWSTRAIEEAQVQGLTHEVWSDEEAGFRAVPQGPVEVPADAAYLHYTSNNTIYGTQFAGPPLTNQPATDRPLVCDMSSDLISRPVDVGQYAMIYGGAQKNAGPSGITVVIAARDLTRTFRGAPTVPIYLRYATHAKKGSMYNTPNTWGIYVAALVAEWVIEGGGLSAMAARNAEKAARLYDLIDSSDALVGHAEPHSRSVMNVTWRMADPEAELALLAAAADAHVVGIKGHRSVGGLRASLYNAVSLESVEVLVDLIKRVA